MTGVVHCWSSAMLEHLLTFRYRDRLKIEMCRSNFDGDSIQF